MIMVLALIVLKCKGRLRYTPGYEFDAALHRLEVAGYSCERVERIFDMPGGFCQRLARDGSMKPEDIALFRIISTLPELAGMAECGYSFDGMSSGCSDLTPDSVRSRYFEH